MSRLQLGALLGIRRIALRCQLLKGGAAGSLRIGLRLGQSGGLLSLQLVQRSLLVSQSLGVGRLPLSPSLGQRRSLLRRLLLKSGAARSISRRLRRSESGGLLSLQLVERSVLVGQGLGIRRRPLGLRLCQRGRLLRLECLSRRIALRQRLGLSRLQLGALLGI